MGTTVLHSAARRAVVDSSDFRVESASCGYGLGVWDLHTRSRVDDARWSSSGQELKSGYAFSFDRVCDGDVR